MIFYLENKVEAENKEEAGSSAEAYKRYWTDTLEVLHSKNGVKFFCGVTPPKGAKQWIGWTPVNGMGITIRCVANQDLARVEFYIGSSDKDHNKKIYDYLYSKKEEIEKQLEKALIWYRGNDNKASKICVENRDLGIVNENDWDKMTKYHAQWSKKFYDVFVPYVNKYME